MLPYLKAFICTRRLMVAGVSHWLLLRNATFRRERSALANNVHANDAIIGLSRLQGVSGHTTCQVINYRTEWVAYRHAYTLSRHLMS